MPRYLYLHGQARFRNMCLVKCVSAYYCQIETLGIEMSPENKMVSFFSYLCPTPAASAVDAFTLDTKSHLFSIKKIKNKNYHIEVGWWCNL